LRIFNKGVEVEEEFAHGGNEGAFVVFTAIKDFEDIHNYWRL
jgi:hypothetical protein